MKLILQIWAQLRVELGNEGRGEKPLIGDCRYPLWIDRGRAASRSLLIQIFQEAEV